MFSTYSIEGLSRLPNSGQGSRRVPLHSSTHGHTSSSSNATASTSKPSGAAKPRQREAKKAGTIHVPPPPAEAESEVDVLIVGSGPLGSAFARYLLDPDVNKRGDGFPAPRVLMVDVGQFLSNVPGENIKNAYYYQKNVNQFTPVVQGTLQAISIAPDSQALPYPADPTTFHPNGQSYMINNINPEQMAEKNLPAAATTYAIGGMATHWTCCIPRTRGQQVPSVIPQKEWDELYPIAEGFLGFTADIFHSSLRQQVIKKELLKKYEAERVVPMPIAGKLNAKNPHLITWGGADTVLGHRLLDPKQSGGVKGFTLLSQHRATQLTSELRDGKTVVTGAWIDDLQGNRRFWVSAKVVVVACNPILTPQLLFNSNLGNEALGRYLMDQPMTFCQILLSNTIVQEIASMVHTPPGPMKDPVPIPADDLPPAILLQYTDAKPWHVQIHKDTFSYGMVPQSLDPRLVVDIRYFGYMEAEAENRVEFSTNYTDLMGMPQPTFIFKLSDEDGKRQHQMMQEMVEVANYLGGFLPGAEPRCMPWGTSLHFQGTTRIGPTDDGTSVCDVNSRVWETTNLFLGGNGCIPTSLACNPTLTSVCLAIKASRYILQSFFTPTK